MRERYDLVASFKQKLRYSHIKHRVGHAVITCYQYKHLIIRSETVKQKLTLLLNGSSVLPDSHCTGKKSLCTEGFRNAENPAKTDHCTCHCFFSEIKVEYRT